MLDQSGIKHRVIVISACYAGGFIDALKNDDTLVITAAAKDRKSFGCSNEAEFTYFGEAYFRDALDRTLSFTEAFEIAKPAIAEREAKTEYEHSEPQMFVGSRIQGTLDAYAQQPAPESTRLPLLPASVERLQLAREFVRVSGLQKEMRMTGGLCEKNSKRFPPESFLRGNPNFFGGLQPSNPRWPQVVAAYDDYYRESCMHPSPDGMLDLTAHVYAEDLSSAELRRLIAFESTSDGRDLSASSLRVFLALDEFAANERALEEPKASAKLQQDLQKAMQPAKEP